MRKTGRIFQAGTQRRTVSHYQQAVQIARDGKLGRLTKLVASVTTRTQQKLVACRADTRSKRCGLEHVVGAGTMATLQQRLRGW